jgi:hypothetical protein
MGFFQPKTLSKKKLWLIFNKIFKSKREKTCVKNYEMGPDIYKDAQIRKKYIKKTPFGVS